VSTGLHSNTNCSEKLPLYIRKTRLHQEKTLTVDYILQHVQSKDTNQIMFLQNMNYQSYMVTVLWLPFVQIFSEIPVSCTSHSRYFLGDVSSLAPMSSNVSSVSKVCFLYGFLV
jgi:hypothetical protein